MGVAGTAPAAGNEGEQRPGWPDDGFPDAWTGIAREPPATGLAGHRSAATLPHAAITGAGRDAGAALDPVGLQHAPGTRDQPLQPGSTLDAASPHQADSRPAPASPARQFARALVMVVPAWLTTRVLVLASLAIAHATVAELRPGNAGARGIVHQGLLSWDGYWYRRIAAHGYVASGVQSVRFSPAFPLAGRIMGGIPGVGVGAALLIISNLTALAALAALWILVRHDLGDAGLARRSVWLLSLAPAAYTMVLAYADAALLLGSVVTFLAARSGRWWWAAAAGLVAGTVRPVGILLVVPVAIELWSQRSSATVPSRAARMSALLAPVVGSGAYLGWVAWQFGDPWLPMRVQLRTGLRGSVTLPFGAMGHNLASAFHGHQLVAASHVLWVVACVVLTVVALRRLPVSYGAFAAVVLVVSLASSNLNSFERYAMGAFPLVVAASTLTSRRRVAIVVLAIAGLSMVAYSLLAFVGLVVP